MKADFFVCRQSDAFFPSLLKEIHDPPGEFTFRGTLPDPILPHIAVVGSRQASAYGQQVARELVRDLAGAGVVIVSGLAYGIDQIAHEAAIDAGGTTVAVLGFGIAHRPAVRERQLQEHILQNGGALISDFPPDEPGHKYNFPKRNRLISGMCHGTLVVEAAMKSGSLITARLSMEQNRDVFSVPGPITSATSAGTNHLLKEGATPVTSAHDIFEALNMEASGSPKEINVSEEERAILQLLSRQPTHVDDVIRGHNGASNVVSALLTTLEIGGYVKDIGGGYFVLN